VDPGGVISTLGAPGRFVTPSRLAYRAGGWLYVASENGSLTAVDVVKGHPYQVATIAHPRKHATIARPRKQTS